MVSLRWAEPNEGYIIRDLCHASSYLMEHWVDWSKPLQQNWILAETTKPVGCVMVNWGVPFGRLEYLLLAPGLPTVLHAKVLSGLYKMGLYVLKKAGSQVVNFDIRDTDLAWQRAAERRGGWCVGTGKFYVRKV